MYLTPAQIKGRIKNVAKQNGSDPITLLRIYMMERFLERITYSAPIRWHRRQTATVQTSSS